MPIGERRNLPINLLKKIPTDSSDLQASLRGSLHKDRTTENVTVFFDNLSYSVIIIMFLGEIKQSLGLLDQSPLQSVVKKLVLLGLFLSQVKTF